MCFFWKMVAFQAQAQYKSPLLIGRHRDAWSGTVSSWYQTRGQMSATCGCVEGCVQNMSSEAMGKDEMNPSEAPRVRLAFFLTLFKICFVC